MFDIRPIAFYRLLTLVYVVHPGFSNIFHWLISVFSVALRGI